MKQKKGVLITHCSKAVARWFMFMVRGIWGCVSRSKDEGDGVGRIEGARENVQLCGVKGG